MNGHAEVVRLHKRTENQKDEREADGLVFLRPQWVLTSAGTAATRPRAESSPTRASCPWPSSPTPPSPRRASPPTTPSGRGASSQRKRVRRDVLWALISQTRPLLKLWFIFGCLTKISRKIRISSLFLFNYLDSDFFLEKTFYSNQFDLLSLIFVCWNTSGFHHSHFLRFSSSFFFFFVKKPFICSRTTSSERL